VRLLVMKSSCVSPWYKKPIKYTFIKSYLSTELSKIFMQFPCRSRSLSVYLFIFYGALSIGQLLLNVADPTSLIPYCLASFLSSLAILPIAIFSLPIPAYECEKRFSLRQIFSISPKGFLGGTVSGMVLASIYGLGPIYGQSQGLSVTDTTIMMSVIILGGVSLQWPLGKWADFSGRRKILVFACFGAGLIGASIAAFSEATWPMKLILLWLFGGFSFVLYPLSMAFTCEGIKEGQIVVATSGFILAYGLGAITGPLIAPQFMNWIGSNGLFYYLSSACFAMGLIGALTHNRE